MSRKKLVFIISVLVIIISILSIVVYAYFSTYAVAEGSANVRIKFPVTYIEKNSSGDISIEIVESSTKYNYIRVKFIIPESVSVEKKDTIDWYWKNDYLYYKNTVDVGEKIIIPELGIDDNYNVGICVEAIKASFNEAGEMCPNFDWTINYENK